MCVYVCVCVCVCVCVSVFFVCVFFLATLLGPVCLQGPSTDCDLSRVDFVGVVRLTEDV